MGVRGARGRDVIEEDPALAAALTVGRTSVTSSPVAGRIAVKMQAQRSPSCRTPGGRSAHAATSGGRPGPCCRPAPRPRIKSGAGSRATARSACRDGGRQPRPSARRAPLFEALLRLGIAPRVMGPRMSRARSRAAEAPGSCSRGGRSCRGAARAGGTDRPASRHESPSSAGSGPREARRCKLGLLLRREPPWRPPPRPVPEPGETFGLVAQHRAAQRPALHASEPRRLRSAQAVERMGDGARPRRRPIVLLPTRRPPNAVGRQSPTDLQRNSHGPPTSSAEQNHAALFDRTL